MLGIRCSAYPAYPGSAPLRPSSAGPGRTLFGPTSLPCGTQNRSTHNGGLPPQPRSLRRRSPKTSKWVTSRAGTMAVGSQNAAARLPGWVRAAGGAGRSRDSGQDARATHLNGWGEAQKGICRGRGLAARTPARGDAGAPIMAAIGGQRRRTAARALGNDFFQRGRQFRDHTLPAGPAWSQRPGWRYEVYLASAPWLIAAPGFSPASGLWRDRAPGFNPLVD